MIIVEENKKDDQVDADGDGIADAKQISGRELLRRKVKLVLAKMNPEKVNTALAAIYKVWMSVLAVLTIEFARTIALSLTISQYIKKIADRFLLPLFKKATPDEYQVCDHLYYKRVSCFKNIESFVIQYTYASPLLFIYIIAMVPGINGLVLQKYRNVHRVEDPNGHLGIHIRACRWIDHISCAGTHPFQGCQESRGYQRRRDFILYLWWGWVLFPIHP
mmetsp:Transcript_6477/g.14303  ORF Transcript_6477/g.14303 Transcript_6477/m.14303 type:complete len:219 (+) Transcript_6477:769-1425(+)